MRFLLEIWRWEFAIDVALLFNPFYDDEVADCGCSYTSFWIFSYRSISSACVTDAMEQINFELDEQEKGDE